jgi:antitoxin (DNA-binding transcriptional repressor) of toxin-antitoxin stability system
MADAATLRQHVADLLTRVLAGGETDLVARLVHPDFVNNEAAAERRHGPEGARFRVRDRHRRKLRERGEARLRVRGQGLFQA